LSIAKQHCDILPGRQYTQQHLKRSTGARPCNRPEEHHVYEGAVTTTVQSVSFSFRRGLGQISFR